MTLNGPFPGQPGDGWQLRALPAVAQLAAQDARISDFRVHGSASGAGAAIDRWSDLDVLIRTPPPGSRRGLAPHPPRRLRRLQPPEDMRDVHAAGQPLPAGQGPARNLLPTPGKAVNRP
jgi:hypothetical protein